MRIAVNVTRDYVAGISSANLNLLHHLLRQDHEFVLVELADKIYMKGPVQFRSFSPETFDHHIINIHHLPFKELLQGSKSLRELQAAYEPIIALIQNVLHETKPDCVLLNGTYYLPWLISIAAEREGIPILLWYAGIITREEEHQPLEKKRIFTDMERSVVRRAKNVIFPSKLCRDSVEKLVTKKKLAGGTVIPNPIAPLFMEPSVVSAHMRRSIAAVGRFEPIKNFKAFFAIHERLREEGWEHDASFVSVITPELERASPKDLTVVGPMNEAALKAFLLKQSLVIAPSKFETFGNVPMEAASLGVPVLVSQDMGCAEVLRAAGLPDMVADFSDIDRIAERVKQLAGKEIAPARLNALHRLLDPRTIGQRIDRVLARTAKKRKAS